MIKVKIIPVEDIKDVVLVHESAFKGFFLTELGSSFLRLYYNSVRKSPIGVLIGAYDNEHLLGFCAACKRSKGFNTHLIMSNFFRFSFVGLKLLFTSPNSLVRLVKNMSKNSGADDDGNYAEVLSIGVSREAQGRGVGKLLLMHLQEIFSQDGIKRLSLTTDYSDNDNTLNFYQSMNFVPMYDFVTYPSRRMYRLIKDL
jgi:ribosomal protein S18 acetylase RimI-like enzyme